jgi:hypothetical protein
MELLQRHRYEEVVDEICNLKWSTLSGGELMRVAWAYYHFSVQFRETVQIACARYPGDRGLAELREGECDTDNLSPCPGIVDEGERVNHDEFMRRVLVMSNLDRDERIRVDRLGRSYLAEIRRVDADTRIMSLASYEDGGLEKVFSAILLAEDWNDPSLAAFHHFLVGHIQLDSDPDLGHGALCRHLVADDRILPLWRAFRNVLVEAAPGLVE